MPTVKLLIVSNNCNWQSWPQKINDLTAFFKSVCNLQIALQKTSFTNIPFSTFAPTLTAYEVYPDGAKVMEVDQSWYQNAIVPLANGYDIVLLTLPLSTWPLNDTVRGVTQLGTRNPVQIQVGADENEAVYVNLQKLFDSFEHYAEHEIMHALFAIAKTNDTTHYWDFLRNNLAGALGDLHLTPNLATATLLQYLFAKASALLEIINKLISMPSTPPTPPKQPVQPPTPPEPITGSSPVLLWDTPANVRHSIRVMCDNAGLPLVPNVRVNWRLYTPKDIITACIKQESNFNPRAIGKTNPDGTTDYGLCQFNNGRNRKTGVYYWIGPGATFANTQEVLNNPEKNVLVMIAQYKAGNISLWSSYSTGAYKQWL